MKQIEAMIIRTSDLIAEIVDTPHTDHGRRYHLLAETRKLTDEIIEKSMTLKHSMEASWYPLYMINDLTNQITQLYIQYAQLTEIMETETLLTCLDISKLSIEHLN